MNKKADANENWIYAGDIQLPSLNWTHVYWNFINWKIAIKYEKKEVGGEEMMILQRAGQLITASCLELARIEADKLYTPSHYW